MIFQKRKNSVLIVRIIIFLCINFSVMLLFGSILSLFQCNLDHIIKYMIITGICGIGGAILSLYFSKFIALSLVNGSVITVPSTNMEHWLLEIMHQQSSLLKINTPQLAIYDSLGMNAFATGYKKSTSLIAISTSLLKNMSPRSIEAVIAHEMHHIASGDMIMMTLMQGVINTFVMFISHGFTQCIIYGKSILSNMYCDSCHENNFQDASKNIHNSLIYVTISSILELLFGIIANIIVLWFSRTREFYADAGSAKLVGCDKMISALEELQRDYYISNILTSSSIKTLYIAGINHNMSNILNNLFSSHPPLRKRIEALKNHIYLNKSSYFF